MMRLWNWANPKRWSPLGTQPLLLGHRLGADLGAPAALRPPQPGDPGRQIGMLARLVTVLALPQEAERTSKDAEKPTIR